MVGRVSSALAFSVACALFIQSAGQPPNPYCAKMTMGQKIMTKMVQLPNTPPLIFAKTGWMGTDILNEVLTRLVSSHQRCPCPWVETDGNKKIIMALADKDLNADKSKFFSPQVALVYNGAGMNIQKLTLQKTSLTTKKTGLEQQKAGLEKQKAGYAKAVAANPTPGNQANVKKNAGALAGVTSGIAKLGEGIKGMTAGIAGATKAQNGMAAAYNKADSVGAYTCNIQAMVKVDLSAVPGGLNLAPFSVGVGAKKFDFAICWEGSACYASAARSQVDGGFLNISTTHKWLVPDYLKAAYADPVSAMKANPALVASTGMKFYALKSPNHRCAQWNDPMMNAQVAKFPTGCMPVAPPTGPMASKGCTSSHLCTNLNSKILQQNGITGLSVEVLPEDQLIATIAQKLRARENFIVHAPEPSYIVSNYADRLASIPIPLKTTPSPPIMKPHQWFPTIPAKIVYSTKLIGLVSGANTKCGPATGAPDANALGLAKSQGCKAPYPKTLKQDMDALYADSFQKLAMTLPPPLPGMDQFQSDLSYLLHKLGEKMDLSLNTDTTIYQGIVQANAIVYWQNPPVPALPPGRNTKQVANTFVAAHKFPRTADKTWPAKLKIFVYDKCEPFAICPQGMNTHASNITGIAIEHIKAALLFIGYSQPSQYELKCVSDPDALVQMARKNMLDIATGCVSARADRMQIVKFAGEFYTSGLGIMTVKEVAKQNMFSFLEPFTLKMWMMVLGLGTLYGIFSNLFERIYNRDNFPFPVWSFAGLLDAELFGISMLLQDGGEKGLTQYSGRFLKVIFQFLVVVIMTVYTGQVTATLTIAGLGGDIARSADLNGKLVLTSPENTYAYKYLKEQLPGAITVAGEKDDLPTLVARLREGKESALVYNYHQLKYYANKDPTCSLLVPAQEVGFGFEEYGIMTPYDSDIASSIKEVVGFRKAANMDDEIVGTYMEDVCDMSSYYNVDPLAPVTVEGYYGLTVMFAGVACICVALWLFENKIF